MRTRVKSVAIVMISVMFLAAVAVSVWLLNKGLQQDKTYSGARFVYQEKVEEKAAF
ncbi:MAG: hypothetical protein FWJ59_03045 [Caldicoprobacter sp.]|uniref:hypothetical protein n=1 Tax=Caldicoprobacter sp. TaxID=2004500 RepID=UPI0039C03188